MRDCGCGTSVAEDRRTCPGCGREINPAGTDPTIQDTRRSTTIIAGLRSEMQELSTRATEAEERRKLAETGALALKESLAGLSTEHSELINEMRELNERLRTLEERAKLLRAQFDALGISTFRPWDASQAPLFPTAFSETAKHPSSATSDEPSS